MSVKKDINKFLELASMLTFSSLVIALISWGVDSVFVYSVVESIFFDNWVSNLFVSLTIAFGLDGIPIIVAALVMKENKTKLDITILITSVSIFLILIISVFCLRWVQAEQIYSAEDGNVNIYAEEEAFEATDGQKIMTVLMSVIPLSTSVITFAFAINKTPEERRKEFSQRMLFELEERKSKNRLEIAELQEQIERDLDAFESTKADIARREAHAQLELKRWFARMLIAMKLEDPNAVTLLLENLEMEAEKKGDSSYV